MRDERVQRREFMKTVALAGAVSVLPEACRTLARETTPKPDILLIMPDQMRGDCLSILGHPAVRTPTLDELVRQGTLFRRAYTPVASCIPARYALLTGLSPQTSGVVGFRAKPFATPSLPDLLSKAGYGTVLVGRNMHQVPASGSCGYQKRILGSTYVSGDEYHKFLKRAVPEAEDIRKYVTGMGLTYNHWQAKPWPLPAHLHPTEWVVAQSRRVVEAAEPDQPLFLTTSFYAPHPPLFPPRKYFDAYMQRELPSPAHGTWVNWGALSTEGDRTGHRVMLTGKTLKTAQAGYFGLIEHLDDQISSLIRDFRARSEKARRPWLIVFTTDHGEMLGDHGYFRKCEPYEGSANIPLIISGSPALGFESDVRNHQPVCLEDIMPTLLALAGVDCPAHVDGVNLAPTLREERQTIRRFLHFEHAPCYSQAQAYHALTDGQYKYIWRPIDGTEQLFDLEADPREEDDLSRAPSHQATLKMWRRRLIERLANRPEGFVQDDRLIPGRPYRPLNDGTKLPNSTIP
ncbi:MAG: sulfatase-like hydrolase/transferase [Planctomycetota bacterium]|jgi:arylsulfatase A-like enzyme